MTFAEELQDEAGIPSDHALKSGCFGSFLLGILFSVLFLVTVFIKPNQSNITLFVVVFVISLLSHWIHKNISRTLHFHKDGMTITTVFFGRQQVELVPSSAIKLVTGVGGSAGGRVARVFYSILVKTRSGRTIKPGFREFVFEEINPNIEELAQRMGVSWERCEEYIYDPD